MLDRWLIRDAPRLVRILLGLQVFALCFFIAGSHGAFGPMPKPPTTTDFASFYAAGVLANAGRAADAYDPVLHRQAEEIVIAPGVDEKRFLYPPIFLLACRPLARLPYLPAFIVFEALTSLVWLALCARITGMGAAAAAWIATIPSVWWALGWGQNSFLSASLMASGTLLLRSRPLLAGAAFGALSFKPHFGILIPVALLFGRHWRAIGGAVATISGLAAISLLACGKPAWLAFIDMTAHARQTAETGIKLTAHVDPGGAARLAGLGAGLSWGLQACVSLAALALTAWAFAATSGRNARPECMAAANALLIAATLTAMPFVLFYDLVMAGVAVAWLARAAGLAGWRERELTWLAAAFMLCLAAYPSGAAAHVALGAFVAPILLLLAARRVRAAAAAA